MRAFVVELARTGGRLAREHFRSRRVTATAKAARDYVSHVDGLVEDAIATRIRNHYPSHRILGEEGGDAGGAADAPLWIIDPIDGTTNFIRGIARFAISIAYCDAAARPLVGVVYDPIANEMFIAEDGIGLWLNEERVQGSGCRELAQALISCPLPFRSPVALDDLARLQLDLQRDCDDLRRAGAAALDLAEVAVGRQDAYVELGIHCWDTAAGELLVRMGGGRCSDFRGDDGRLTTRRSIVAAASPELHATLLARVAPYAGWLARPPFDAVP